MALTSALVASVIVMACLDIQVDHIDDNPNLRTMYDVNDRITILSNSEFHDAAVAEGWSGDGSEESPYIIENLDIKSTGSSGESIRIADTDVFFEIRSCYLWNESMVLGIGISLMSVSNGTISENLITCTDGILLTDCCNMTIAGNQCLGGPSIGMGVDESSSIVISENSIQGYGNAIQILNSDNMTLECNNCVSNSINGLMISGLATGNLTRNEFVNNDAAGIQASGMVLSNISSNEISFNGQQGIIFVSDCHFNGISLNTFEDNTLEGLKIQTSSGNRIHNNTFIDNNGAGTIYDEDHAQAFDAYGTNYWNSSTHGNYWSDWLAPDDNLDGIVDEPYEIGPFNPPIPEYGATDYFPLTVSSTPIPEFSSLISLIVAIMVIIAISGLRRRRRSQ